MVERNKITEALILSVKDSGEKNRTVCAISPDLGIFYATLYGGPKSKLKSLVQPFNWGVIYIYDDESRNMKKVSDFDVKNFHSGLKESLYKMWASNLAGEILLKTKCGGDDRLSYILIKAFVDGLDKCEENVSTIATIRFLWRYIGLLGVQPDVSTCCCCNKDIFGGNGLENDKILSYFIPAQSGFICDECKDSYVRQRAEINLFYEMNLQSLKYLDAINNSTPGEVRRMSLNADSINQLKRFCFSLIESAVGSQLLSLSSGMGIF